MGELSYQSQHLREQVLNLLKQPQAQLKHLRNGQQITAMSTTRAPVTQPRIRHEFDL